MGCLPLSVALSLSGWRWSIAAPCRAPKLSLPPSFEVPGPSPELCSRQLHALRPYSKQSKRFMLFMGKMYACMMRLFLKQRKGYCLEDLLNFISARISLHASSSIAALTALIPTLWRTPSGSSNPKAVLSVPWYRGIPNGWRWSMTFVGLDVCSNHGILPVSEDTETLALLWVARPSEQCKPHKLDLAHFKMHSLWKERLNSSLLELGKACHKSLKAAHRLWCLQYSLKTCPYSNQSSFPFMSFMCTNGSTTRLAGKTMPVIRARSASVGSRPSLSGCTKVASRGRKSAKSEFQRKTILQTATNYKITGYRPLPEWQNQHEILQKDCWTPR